MRHCDLTDEQLEQHARNFRKLAAWAGSPEAVTETATGLTCAIEELLDRRAADRQLQETRNAHV
jgi:hypothetical protein